MLPYETSSSDSQTEAGHLVVVKNRFGHHRGPNWDDYGTIKLSTPRPVSPYNSEGISNKSNIYKEFDTSCLPVSSNLADFEF
jgi:hypothetical protein